MTVAAFEEVDRAAYLDQLTILRCEVGSTAHGVTHSTNDHDETAIYIPDLSDMVSLSRPDFLIYRPGRKPHEPSGPGDLDRNYYSLRKFVGLLANGNPSILYALYAPVLSCTSVGLELREFGPQLRNHRTRNAYLGYAAAQRERIQGTRGSAGRKRRSPEGGGDVDWKYAMHMLRLGIQGHEFLSTGYISCPSLELDFLKSVRYGEVPLDEVITKAFENEEKMKNLDLVDETIDWNSYLTQAHYQAWYG